MRQIMQQDNPDDFKELFYKQIIANGFRVDTQGVVTSEIATITCDSPAGNSMRYVKEGTIIEFQVWPTGSEQLETNIEFHWNGTKWIQPLLKIALTTPELVCQLVHSGE